MTGASAVSLNDVLTRVADLQASLVSLQPVALRTAWAPTEKATTQSTSMFAKALARASDGSPAARRQPTDAGGPAVSFALGHLGTPYQWGGESSSGYDCSGLVHASYRAAGIALPRVAQEQYGATLRVASGEPLRPGDLVFFDSDREHINHVGIVVGDGKMIHAPTRERASGSIRTSEPIWSERRGRLPLRRPERASRTDRPGGARRRRAAILRLLQAG